MGEGRPFHRHLIGCLRECKLTARLVARLFAKKTSLGLGRGYILLSFIADSSSSAKIGKKARRG